MSKAILLSIMFSILLVGCAEKDTETYTPPDLKSEIARISATPDIQVPEGGRPSLRLTYLVKTDKVMKSAVKVVDGPMIVLAISENPDVRRADFDRYMRKFKAELDVIMLDVMEGFATLYEKYYTDVEILELVQFHETPIGQKFVVNQTVMMPEAQQIGGKLGGDWCFAYSKKGSFKF